MTPQRLRRAAQTGLAIALGAPMSGK